MEKKVKSADSPLISKIIYATVIAILCVSAIIVGIVAAANRKPTEEPDPIEQIDEKPDEKKTDEQPGTDEKKEEKKLAFGSPCVGTVAKSHSTTVPVYSDTLGEWRVHLGLDVETEEGADVFASEEGTVNAVYRDPMLGECVEILHTGGIMTLYANLTEAPAVKVGDKVTKGQKIGNVGDTTVSELADEAHLHFEMKVNGTPVDPLDYLTAEAKTASLGITNPDAT